MFGAVIQATTGMLPGTVGAHLRDLYEATVGFTLRRSSLFLGGPTVDHSEFPSPPVPSRSDNCSACPCNSSPASGSTLPSMRRELDVARAELSRSRIELSKLDERCKLLEDTLRETNEALRLKEIEIEKLRGTPKSGRRRSDGDQKRTQVLAKESHVLNQNQHQRRGYGQSASHEDHEGEEMTQAMSTVQEQSVHTRSLEIFLTKTDLWSGAQVIQAVHDLNSEILQFAASASELCTFDRFARSAPSQSTQEIIPRLGPKLSRMLATRDHAQDPILVQLALQGCISTFISGALSSFCIGLQAKSNAVLSTIYAHIALSEPQPTSARWRALTHRHIHDLQPNLEEREVNELAETTFRLSSDILRFSGCSNTGTTPTLCEGLRVRFGEQVRRIARTVRKLAQVTKEEIMSTNFEVVAVEHSESFDAKSMHDAFGDYGPSRGAVLCTTELGLRCTTRISGELGKTEAEGTIERRLLLRPKVLLESVVDVLDPK